MMEYTKGGGTLGNRIFYYRKTQFTIPKQYCCKKGWYVKQ